MNSILGRKTLAEQTISMKKLMGIITESPNLGTEIVPDHEDIEESKEVITENVNPETVKPFGTSNGQINTVQHDATSIAKALNNYINNLEQSGMPDIPANQNGMTIEELHEMLGNIIQHKDDNDYVSHCKDQLSFLFTKGEPKMRESMIDTIRNAGKSVNEDETTKLPKVVYETYEDEMKGKEITEDEDNKN